MNLSAEIAKHLRQVYFGGNWTCVNLKDTLAGVTWEQATTKVHSFNTIATLVYHINYYADVQTKVLQGEPLNGKDEESFKTPPITSDAEWQEMLNKTWDKANMLADLITQLQVDKLSDTFTDEKYGTYYRNLQGMIEHTHYHLGQIVLIKKLLAEQP
jgi:hypothetical protein